MGWRFLLFCHSFHGLIGIMLYGTKLDGNLMAWKRDVAERIFLENESEAISC